MQNRNYSLQPRSLYRSLIALLLTVLFMAPAVAQTYPTDPRLPLSSLLPGVGQTVGLNLAHECEYNTQLPVAHLPSNGLQLASITLTATQVDAMYATPIQVIPASATGTSIVIYQALARFTHSTAFSSGGAVQLQYGNTDHAGGTTPLTTLAANVLTGSSSADTQLQQAGASTTTTQATGIYITNATAAFTSGTSSTLTIYVWYAVE